MIQKLVKDIINGNNELKTLEDSKIAKKCKEADNMFPPDDMWVDYYIGDKIKNLSEIIIKPKIIKKKCPQYIINI